MKMNKDTSWQKVSEWYGGVVGEKGHYFHRTVVIPKSIALMGLNSGEKILDIACGQGIFGRSVPGDVEYVGVDISENLISEARRLDKNIRHRYMVADVTREVKVNDMFDKAVIILAIQNIREPEKAIRNVSEKVRGGGQILLVLNHPCFRIPRQSSWEIDKKNRLEYRRINRYMSPLEIPINMHPGMKTSPVTWSFHHPLSDYVRYLNNSGFLIKTIEEWISPKTSEGKSARQENRARDEFPMFMAILAVKG